MKKRVKISKVYIGSDHAGYDLKEEIKKFLEERKINYEDLSKEYDGRDDYPDHAFRVAEQVVRDKDSRGILICGTGTGMTIAANKVKGIRAVAAYDAYSARMSREHNDTNVLGLRGWDFSLKKIKEIVDIWLKTEFSEEERHDRRIRKIHLYESK